MNVFHPETLAPGSFFVKTAKSTKVLWKIGSLNHKPTSNLSSSFRSWGVCLYQLLNQARTRDDSQKLAPVKSRTYFEWVEKLSKLLILRQLTVTGIGPTGLNPVFLFVWRKMRSQFHPLESFKSCSLPRNKQWPWLRSCKAHPKAPNAQNRSVSSWLEQVLCSCMFFQPFCLRALLCPDIYTAFSKYLSEPQATVLHTKVPAWTGTRVHHKSCQPHGTWPSVSRKKNRRGTGLSEKTWEPWHAEARRTDRRAGGTAGAKAPGGLGKAGRSGHMILGCKCVQVQDACGCADHLPLTLR